MKTGILIDGTKITPLCSKDVVTEIIKSLEHKDNVSNKTVTFLNAYVYCLTKRNLTLNAIVSESDIVVSDGVSIVGAALLLKGIKIPRCIMTKAFDEFLISSKVPVCNAILIGTTEDEIKKAQDKMNLISRNVNIVNAYSGYHTQREYSEIFNDHRNIDVIFIGMGSPKSEYVCKLAKELCQHTIIWHIGGGTIKCYAGTKKRAPEWTSKMGVEWLHRFLYEKHTRKRYLIHNAEFVYLILKGFFRSKVRVSG